MRVFIAFLSFVVATAVSAQAPRPADSDAERFLTRAERILDSLSIRVSRAQWVQQNFITDDTEILNAEASTALSIAVQQLATEAKKYDKANLPAATKRRLLLLKLGLAAPPPPDAKKASELSTLVANLDATYGKGEYCRPGMDGAQKTCLAQQDVSRILAESRINTELVDVWKGWHTISVPMRDKYTRFVELSNEGARGIGFADAGAMWRSGYDMPPDEFAKEMERAWNQLKPLYTALHAYVRTKLYEKYGSSVMKPDGPIPSQLLGNIWAQDWANIYDVVAPPGGTSSVDVTELLKAKKVDEVGMVHYAENFFTSLGFPKLPETFWKRSLFLKPADREVVCHASAWDIDNREDLRIKMCIERTGEMFNVVHHELGHNFYQRAYKQAAVPVPEWRERRLPRSDRRCRSALDHAEVPPAGRTARAVATGVERHAVPPAEGAREDRLPPVRAPRGPVALEGVRGRSNAGELQQGVVGSQAAVPGRRAAR